MAPSLTTDTVSTPRLTYRSSIPFATAEVRLRASIQRKADESTSPTAAYKTSDLPTSSKASFEAWVASKVGPHDFMYFTEFNHGAWLPLYEPPTSTIVLNPQTGEKKHLKATRFLLGNPLIARTMIQHDLDAGLSVPIELLLVEEVDGGVRIVQYKPSGLVAGYQGAKDELVQAATALDKKIDNLIRWVLHDEDNDDDVKGHL